MSAGVVREIVLSTLREALDEARATGDLKLNVQPALVLDAPNGLPHGIEHQFRRCRETYPFAAYLLRLSCRASAHELRSERNQSLPSVSPNPWVSRAEHRHGWKTQGRGHLSDA